VKYLKHYKESLAYHLFKQNIKVLVYKY